MIRLPPRSTQSRSSAASDVYKRQVKARERGPTVSADEKQIFRQQRIRAPIVSDDSRMPGNIPSEKDQHPAQDACQIDASPMCGAVHALPAVTLLVASQSRLEIARHQLVSDHHYLR